MADVIQAIIRDLREVDGLKQAWDVLPTGLKTRLRQTWERKVREEVTPVGISPAWLQLRESCKAVISMLDSVPPKDDPHGLVDRSRGLLKWEMECIDKAHSQPELDAHKLCPHCGKQHTTIVEAEDCEWFRHMEAVVGEHGWLRPVVAVIDNPEGPEELRVFRNPRAAAVQGWEDHCASTYRVCDLESITGRDFTEVTELQAVLERAQNILSHRPSKMLQLEQGIAAMDAAVGKYRRLYSAVQTALPMLKDVATFDEPLTEMEQKLEKTIDLLKLGLEHMDLQEPQKPTTTGETCACCGHAESEHTEGDCRGVPKDEQLDAGGECPCNGFVRRDRRKEN